MSALPLSARLGRLLEHASLTTDVARALRSSVAFMVPLVIFQWRGHPEIGVFVAVAAQNVALTDVRGDYRLRFAVLLTMTFVMAGSALLGTLTGGNMVAATLAMGGIALLGGLWRHLSGDYGPRLAVVSALLFLIALNLPDTTQTKYHLAELTIIGGLGGMALQMVEWFFHPQHPLRHAVAESWVAASDLFIAMRPQTNEGGRLENPAFAVQEQTLRTTLDHTSEILAAAATRRTSALIAHLEAARLAAARFATRVAAFNTALETLKVRPNFAQLEPNVDSVLRALANTARSAALTLLMHRPEQLTALDVRLRRCAHLIQILDERLALLGTNDTSVVQVRQLLEQVSTLLPDLCTILGETVDHGVAPAASPMHLPELSDFSVRSLAAWINPSPQLDLVLVRYSLRMAAITMLAVGLYKAYDIPRGYWIAFTTIVVLQPDFGSTRQKAWQRILGTLAGSLVATGLLWIRLPTFVSDILVFITAFYFAFYVKRRYGLAIFFVTLMLVLAIETTTSLGLEFAISRILSIVAGGALALVAALFFWPHWERQQFPGIMAAAIRANRKFLAAIGTALAAGRPFLGEVVKAKREAEHAGNLAAASLQRMQGDPTHRQDNATRAVALSAYNQRITRALIVLGLQLNQRQRLEKPEIGVTLQHTGEALENLARAIEEGHTATWNRQLADDLAALAAGLSNRGTTGKPTAIDLLHSQLTRVATETKAMTLALNN